MTLPVVWRTINGKAMAAIEFPRLDSAYEPM
jgi:hypothetical protein